MSNIEIFSKAMYSNWCLHAPSRSLFDCGEGCATYLENRIYVVENLFIGHGHGDHVLGIPSFIGCRNSARGDKNKPLNIYHPPGEIFGDLKEFILKRSPNLKYQINWIELHCHMAIELDPKHFILPFSMEHQKNGETFGFSYVEERMRLKKEYIGQNIPELLKGGIKKEDISEKYTHNMFTYALDSFSFDHSHIQDCDLAVMDCTFIDAAERDKDFPVHFTLQESYELCKNARVKKMAISHISSRFSEEYVREKVGQLKDGPETVTIFGDKVYKV